MTLLILLLVLAVALGLDALRLVRSDGRGIPAPPVSHLTDRRFLPPAHR